MRVYKKKEKIPITKYDPKNRNNLGHYQNDEWIGYSDIGKNFRGVLFERVEYERIEALYIKAVFLVLDYFNSKGVKIIHIYKVNNLKRFKKFKDMDLYSDFISFQSGDIIKDRELISKLLKLRLREYIGELELLVDWKSRSEIVFGYDYYMYLRTNKDVSELLSQINKMGLFTSR